MLSGRAMLVWLPGSRVDSLARALGRPRDHRNRYHRQVLTNPGIAMKGLQTGQLEIRPRDRRQVFSDPGPTYRSLPRDHLNRYHRQVNEPRDPHEGPTDRLVLKKGLRQTRNGTTDRSDQDPGISIRLPEISNLYNNPG